MKTVDLLCIGATSWDITFAVDHHPDADEKMTAQKMVACGGGPASNAAVIASRFNVSTAFCGYLGYDEPGESHMNELLSAGVDTEWVVRGPVPTPLSVVLAGPEGKRSLINYRDKHSVIKREEITGRPWIQPRLILVDGHEPDISLYVIEQTRHSGIPVIIDAGSVHKGTELLLNHSDYLICSEKFSSQYCRTSSPEEALDRLSARYKHVIITLGERGLLWSKEGNTGKLAAIAVNAVDSTGAGDVFHGAFAAALIQGRAWPETLKFASAAAALTCTGLGGRTTFPHTDAVNKLLNTVR